MGGKKKKLRDFDDEDRIPSRRRKLFDDFDEYENYKDFDDFDDGVWNRIDDRDYDYYDDDDEDIPNYH